ncbi:hypothetical protein D3C85_1139810 [compost metagenome]
MALLVEHRQRVQVGLAAKGFEHVGRWRVVAHGGLLVEQGAEVAQIIVERHGAAVMPGQQVAGFLWWMLLRATHQVALDQVDAHFAQHREFFRQLDTFGNHLGPRGFGDLQDRADELALEGVQVNAVDEMPVDLHILRT